MVDSILFPRPVPLLTPHAPILRFPLPVPAATPQSSAHPYARCVNPHLADLLRRVWLDKRFVRGEGCELVDEEGRRYLDCISAYGALPFGFNPAEIWQSLQEVRNEAEPSFVQPSLLGAAGELAEQLLAVAPANMRHVTFTNSGAESVEAAIKLCRAATGRPGILSTHNSFHGKTLGALSATGNPDYQQDFGAPTGDFHRIAYGDAEALAREFANRPKYYAAFLVEPIQGEGGVIVPPAGYLSRVREICTQAGVLLVFDEIQTGLGRTGAMFCCELEGVRPDVITLAKALGGGLMPIGAVLCSEEAYTESFALKHSSTFAGNTLACRAGLSSLDLLTRDRAFLVQRVALYGARLKRRLRELQRAYPQLIGEVRGKGFLLGIRFDLDRNRWPESLLGVAAEQGFFTPLFASYLLNVEGVRVAPTLNGKAVIRIEPALTIRWRECEQLLGALERALALFATGDTGRVIGSIVDGEQRPAMRKSAAACEWVRIEPQPTERRFGFLMHPLDFASFAEFDPSLDQLSPSLLENTARDMSDMLESFVYSRGRVVSKTGATAYGEFVTLPWTAEQLAQMRRKQAIGQVRKALHLARDRGAQLVGLGAFTSIVTLSGLAIADEGVPVTTGNSYTAVASAEATLKALSLVGGGIPAASDLAGGPAGCESLTAAIVGATGSIGRAMALLLSDEVGRVVLVGNPDSPAEQVRQRLFDVARDMLRFAIARRNGPGAPGMPKNGSVTAELLSRLPGGIPAASYLPATAGAIATELEPARMDELILDLERRGRLVLSQNMRQAVRQAQVVVTSTNATNTVIGPDDLRPGAVVCDLSRPANVSREVADARPDVVVIDGGIIAAPDGSAFGQFGLGEGRIYACMAETMMLTLGGHCKNTSLGTDLSPQTLQLVKSLAAEHGFCVAKLRSFGQPMEDADWQRFISARKTAWTTRRATGRRPAA
jgi:acetylornithine/succinyldiaminopimelate/putrescine aminotransferase/predicted amino acid dehydrogenase